MKTLSKAEEQMVKDLDRLQSSLISASPSITRSNATQTQNHYKQMLSFRSNDNKSLYVLIFGMFGIIAIIYISLATATATSFISTSSKDRHLLNLEGNEAGTIPVANAVSDQIPAKEMMSRPGSDRKESANTQAIDPTHKPTPEEIAKQRLEALYNKLESAPIKDRALGALICAAIGDALGGPLEFHFGLNKAMTQPMEVGKFIGGEWFPTKNVRIVIQSGQFSNAELAERAKRFYKEAVEKAMKTSGGGFHKLKKWQTTDDTAMAVQMTRGLIEASKEGNMVNGQVSLKRIQQEIANKYWVWANPNPTGDKKTARDRVINNAPFDIGLTIKKILQSKTLKENPDDPVNIVELLKVSAHVNADSVRLNFGSGTFIYS